MCINVWIAVYRRSRIAFVRGLWKIFWLEGLSDRNDLELMILLQLLQS